MIPAVPLEVHTKGPPQALPPCPYRFPSPAASDPDGPVASGGDFAPTTIIAAYREGIFPWPHPRAEQLWFSPDPRAIIPPGGLHVSRRLYRTIRSGRFPRATVDAAFADVMRACAARAEGTWISRRLFEGYVALHELGWAHSFETWTADGELAGGVYGVGVGAMFGAESMFHRATDASKVALVAMMQHLEAIGVQLIDIQVLTPHTERMGGIEVPRIEYLRRLRDALAAEANWGGSASS